MAFCTMDFFGKKLGKTASMNIILPEGEGPYPVLYLLHGYSDNHTNWSRRSSIDRYVMNQDLIVVMPDGGVGFYVNDPRPGGQRYEDHIIEDVVGFIDNAFPTIASRQGRSVAGLSMGGYGAMMLALRHPDMFAATSSLSGALGFTHKPLRRGEDFGPLGDALAEDGEHNCFQLIEKLAHADNLPAIRFDCGKDDFLFPINEEYHAHLETLGVDHVYDVNEGVHDWKYWDTHIPTTVKFVMEHMENTPAKEA